MTLLKKARVIGLGHFLPSHVIHNDDLPIDLNTSDEWIFKRTGIKRRHFAKADEKCSDLAIAAARDAIAMADISPQKIDMVIVATSTPDDVYPATAGRVQSALAIPACPFFDIQAVCAGFVYGLFLANQSIMLGAAKNILLIGSDINSRIIDPADRSTYVLFGDGAGAMVLTHSDDNGDKKSSGIINCKIDGDGTMRDYLFVDGGISSNGTIGKVRMKGQEVFRSAVDKMSKVVEECLVMAALSVGDIDWYVPHQANSRIMDAVCEKLKLDREKVISTVDEHANISAATIPVAMNIAYNEKKIKSGQLLALSALGGGFVWGGALLRWG
ncbi:MAG: beta-ketoacyl-ACP synthase III [Alphaproteobacteria bacterium]